MPQSFFDFSGINETLKTIFGASVGIDVAIFGALRDWSDLKITVFGFLAAIVCVVLFNHINVLKKCPTKILLLLNFLSIAGGGIIYGIKSNWFSFKEMNGVTDPLDILEVKKDHAIKSKLLTY